MQRLSPGTLILGIFAVLFALVGAYGVKKYMQERAPQAAVTEKKEAVQTVPVAVMDIPAGRTIALSDIMPLTLTDQGIAQKKFRHPWMTNATQIIGRTLRQPVKEGQPFDPAAFYPQGIGPDVAAKLKPGERAVAIAYEGSAAQAGLITPGAHVDVSVSLQPGREAQVTRGLGHPDRRRKGAGRRSEYPGRGHR